MNMSTTNKREALISNLDIDSSQMNGDLTPRSVKQVKLETSQDVHEHRSLLTDTNPNAEQDISPPSLAASVGNVDYAAVLNFMKAKIMDLEAKLSQMQGSAPGESTPFINGDRHFDSIMTGLAPGEQSVKRKPARPVLNRVSWVPFKNLYPNEDVYAIDILVVLRTTR